MQVRFGVELGHGRLVATGVKEALSRTLAGMPAVQRMLAAEIRQQRDALVHPGFFTETPWEMLHHIPRYLQALGRRIERQSRNPDRDSRHAVQVAQWWARYADRVAAERPRSHFVTAPPPPGGALR